jgi:N-acetylglucosaminyldiphosphoundecaprenol N-acetyl-beta-D-mannosaminyltransferase
METNRKTILGIPLDLCQPEEFYSKIEAHLERGGLKTVFAVNAEKIMRAQKDRDLLVALQESDFLIPDGIGAVVAVRLIYHNRISRTPGIALMERLLGLSARRGYKVFILGAQPDVNDEACKNILESFPGLGLVGAQHGYLSEQEYESLVDKINGSGADILFVALGSPKQEKWVYRNKTLLKTKICLGIGGSLDVFAGRIPRAPALVQRLGLEWLFRVLREPSRLKRAMVLPRFALAVLRTKFSTKRR